MIVTTAKPLTIGQMIELSKTHDALMDIDGKKCRYMSATENQEIEVSLVCYDEGNKFKFGLRPVTKPNLKYTHLAFCVN